MSVATAQRFTRRHPCPICGGGEDLPRGQGRRCVGYRSANGEYVYCSREEHAGQLPLELTDPPTFRHRLEGDCRCGSRHGLPAPFPSANGRGELVATYDYVDEGGALLFQVCRFANKSFLQRRPDGVGGWTWNRQGVEPVLYRLPHVLDAVAAGQTVYICEGEKDVEAAEHAGVVATTNPGGAGKWMDAYSEKLRDATVVVIADRDEDGQGLRHAREVLRSLEGKAASVALVAPLKGKDLSDHLAAGLDLEQLEPWPASSSAAGDDDDKPFALLLDDFIAAKSKTPPALIGDETENLLPTFGLLLLFAKGGKGKTTLIVEAALHLATGIDWLGFKIERPLRVLFIENEGPREPFRAKLELKRQLWEHELRGAIFVQTFDWGAFTLAEEAYAARLLAFVEQNAIDLVIGDPLDSLGVDGVGSPEDTRKFMVLMGRAGLFRSVAFLLLHHPRKEGAQDELDEVSGAWGGKPDSMLRLDKLEGDRARLSFPKIRWSRRGTRRALILAFDPESESFSVAHEEEDEERDYRAEIEALLADEQWRTPKEIAAPKKDGGIGANVDSVKKELEAHPDLFVMRSGEAAKEVGRHPTSSVWQKVTRAVESPESPLDSRESESGGDSLTFPVREVRSQVTSPAAVLSRADSAEATESAGEDLVF